MMTIAQVSELATFGSTWAVLSVGHNLADHLIGQTDHQAGSKAAPSATEVADGVSPRRGWGACLGHVAQYHMVMAVMLGLAWAVLPLQMSWAGLAAGLIVSAVTHAFFDRRWPVRWLLEHTGSPDFAKLRAAGMNGMYLTDLLCTKSGKVYRPRSGVRCAAVVRGDSESNSKVSTAASAGNSGWSCQTWANATRRFHDAVACSSVSAACSGGEAR